MLSVEYAIYSNKKARGQALISGAFRKSKKKKEKKEKTLPVPFLVSK